jgi:GrpB-like predicted nucleotidyltransferase (UPF0157 family)
MTAKDFDPMTPVAPEHADPYGLGLEPDANRLADYNPLWPRAFAEEAARIRSVVGPLALAIEHYGSTAVPGLRAKPIIDILVGVARIDDGLKMIEPMKRLGYDYATNHGIPEHHIFGRPRVRAYLTHVVAYGGEQWRGSLMFRDQLRANAPLRGAYQELKERLVRETRSRAAYTDGKTEFVLANSRAS